MGKRTKIIGGVGVVGLVVVALAVYVMFFRDSAPVSVDSVEAAEARAEAIADATASGESEDPADETAGVNAAAGDTDGSDDETDIETELATGQPDSNASIGSPTDGLWTVDATIGTFDSTCLTDVCGSSFAGFRINEELANFGAKTVVGRTPDVSGSMELVGTQIIGAEFFVDMATLITDNESRTGALRGPNGGLETNTFPEARFELTQAIELGSIPAEGASVQVQAVGNMTVHGVTNEVTIPLTAELQAGVIIVFGNLEGMLLADYGMDKPTAAVVVSVEDNATMELQLFFSR